MRAANARAHAAAVRAAGARVVVFPELSLTGYHLDAPTVPHDDPRLAPIVDACADTRSLALVASREKPRYHTVETLGRGYAVALDDAGRARIKDLVEAATIYTDLVTTFRG